MSPDSADLICISGLGCIGRNKAPSASISAEGHDPRKQRSDENQGCRHAIGAIGWSGAGVKTVARGLAKTEQSVEVERSREGKRRAVVRKSMKE